MIDNFIRQEFPGNLTKFTHPGKKWEYEWKNGIHKTIATTFTTYPIGDNVELDFFSANNTEMHTQIILKNQLAIGRSSITDVMKTFRKWIISQMSPGKESDLSWANEVPDNYRIYIISFFIDPGLEGHDPDEEKSHIRVNTAEIMAEMSDYSYTDYFKNNLFLKNLILNPEEVYQHTTLPQPMVDYINDTLAHTTLQKNNIKKIKGWLSFLLKRKHTLVMNGELFDSPEMKLVFNVTWFYDGQHLPPLYYTWEPILNKNNAKVYGEWRGDYEEKPEGTFVLQVNKEEYESFIKEQFDLESAAHEISTEIKNATYGKYRESFDNRFIRNARLALDKIFKKLNIQPFIDKRKFRVEYI
jgi:hypothetical protein